MLLVILYILLTLVLCATSGVIGWWIAQQGGPTEAGQVVGEHVEDHRDEYAERLRTIAKFLFGGKRKWVWLVVFVIVIMVVVGFATQQEQLVTIHLGLNPFVDGCGKTQNVDVTAQDLSRGYIVLDFDGPCQQRIDLLPKTGK